MREIKGNIQIIVLVKDYLFRIKIKDLGALLEVLYLKNHEPNRHTINENEVGKTTAVI